MEEQEEIVTEQTAGAETPEELSGAGKALKFIQGLIVGVLVAAVGFVVTLLILFQVGILRVSSTKGSSALSEETAAKISALQGLIELYYLNEVDPETEENGLYRGLVESLDDPYSEYFTAAEYEEQMQNVTRRYYGIGATLRQDSETKEVSVVYVYEDTPASRAGLKVGDKILSANGIDATTVDLETFVEEIRGEEGTDVTLVISRADEKEPRTISITREEVNLPTVQADMVTDDIGMIYISRFATNTAQDFADAVTSLTEQGMKALILDVRYNPGGMLSSVVDVLDQILPKGTVVYTEDKYGNRKDETSDDEHKLTLPLAVLVNEESASAAEILAGAIRDFDYGTLIGTTTFGKGVVQQTIPLTDGSAVKLTVEEYFTPSGENIHGVGISPDIELEYEFLGDEEDEYDYSLDNQIQKAIEVLEKEI